MQMDILYVILQVLSFIGLLCGVFMFWTTKKPPEVLGETHHETLSIIIPARNEALRITPLLASLQRQTWRNMEVIVVDDGSTDNTEEVAKAYGAIVVKSRPIGQMAPGKSNACAVGAQHATGTWLLFLDADVQLVNENSLAMMASSFYVQQGRGILSMQPYHRIVKPYENLSVIFNIIVLTGMNVFTVWRERFQTAGSFGPCILCDRQSYEQTGGHEAAEESIMDDFALSDVFVAQNLPVTNYGGRHIIEMRMYEEGIGQLVEGWTKNLATASQSTHRFVMTLIQLWIFGVIMVTLSPIVAFCTSSTIALMISVSMYIVYGIHVYILARRAGCFHWSIVIVYPLYVLFFTAIFMYSLYRTHILRSVMWRGRKINV